MMRHLCALVVAVCAAGAAFGQPAGFRWPGGAKAAVALTYDDAIDAHLDHAAPDLEAANLRGTFYAIGASDSLRVRMAEWRALAQRGHELGNHTLFHPCSKKAPGRDWVTPERDLETYSVTRFIDEVRVTNSLLQALDGQTVRSLAYTCGDETAGGVSFVDALKPLTPAARSTARAVADPLKVDPYRVPSWVAVNTTGEQMIAFVQEAVRAGGAAVFCFHGVGGGHNIDVARKDHQALVAWLNQHRAEVWTAPFVKVMTHVMAERKRLAGAK